MLVEASSDSRSADAAKHAREQAPSQNGDSAAESRNTLADRIRALQSTASRAASTN
jgi:uncharacterized protein YlxW (UPF0749 family)